MFKELIHKMLKKKHVHEWVTISSEYIKIKYGIGFLRGPEIIEQCIICSEKQYTRALSPYIPHKQTSSEEYGPPPMPNIAFGRIERQ